MSTMEKNSRLQDDLGLGDLKVTESPKKKNRRGRKNKKLQSAQSVCSSLPNITKVNRDATEARTAFFKPSVTDANPLRGGRLRRQSAVDPPREPSWTVDAPSPVADIYAEEYNMNHPRRGVALILNHEHFEYEDVREGSDKDCAKLHRVYQRLGFDVRIHNDLNFNEVMTTLRKLSQEDHSMNDCLLVTVLTHGAKGELYARDHTYDADKLWLNFTADRCRSLAGKPKIFIIQACRGQNLDSGTLMAIRKTSASTAPGADAVDASGGSVRYAIPNNADIIIANATIEGYFAWRNPTLGSWFIQVLCDQLELHHDRRDLQTILTFVACRVAVDHQSDVPGSCMNNMKQIPCILSMLTRLVYFKRKNALQS
ncbi:caspase-1-like isoform X2 [Neocloeon triangulifer]|uniref:caspase-1-like isoform X2 n=1 Tax=Neocloeon triangulifer TaxID=2078957 RepID=UPI00286EF0C7|nr:caspase-1-like isoform X2 [Neocloeon triangulifer]